MSPRKTRFRLTAVAIAAAMACCVSAHAQQGEPIAAPAPAPASAAATPARAQATQPVTAADDKVQKVEVRGTAASYDPRRDDTASRIVVGHEEIVRYGDTSVVDVLKRVPGVTVSGAAGRNGAEIRMRGLGAGYTQVLVNGERAPAGFSLDSLAPDAIERIEVLRAASAEFSTQSIAGTINIVLKKAIAKAQREVKLGVGGGQHFLNPTANLQLSDKAGQLSYSLSLNAAYRKFEQESPTVEEGFDALGRQNLLRNSVSHERGQFSSINLGPRLNWTLENGDTVTSQTFVNVNRFSLSAQGEASTPIGLAPQYSKVKLAVSNQNTFYRQDLNWVHKVDSGAKWDVKLGGVVGDLGNELRRFGYNGAGAMILDSAIHSKGSDRGVTSTGKFSTPVFEGHALSMGWDGGISKRNDARVEEDQPLDGATPDNSDEHYDARVTRLAVYGQDEWSLTPRWSVYLGARWEGIRTRTAGNSFATVDSNTSVLSPLFQTLYKLPGAKSDQLRLAVTRTYKAPDAQSLIPRRFPSLNNSSTDPDYLGNQNLKPELALGVDASYEHYWGEGALLSASASMRRIDNFTRSALVFDNRRWVRLPVNDGQAHTRGVELEAKFPLKSLFATAPALDLRASVSRNWSSVDAVPGPNNRLNAQTPLSATFGVDYKTGALTTGGSFVFKNGGPVRISDTLSSYQSVRRDLEVYGLWKFDPRNGLRVSASNILAQDYIAQSTYADEFGSVNRTSIYPGPVALRATMEMKF
jgi:outer membrane receptor for ferrienterochelin and colicins